MVNKLIIFSGKQYSGKDTAAKIMLEALPDFKRCAMGDIIKLTYGEQRDLPMKKLKKTNLYIARI